MTDREIELLRFVIGFVEATDKAPTFTEMMGAMKLRSKSSVARLLDQLEAKGYIERVKCKQRAILVKSGPPNLLVIDLNREDLTPELRRYLMRIKERLDARQRVCT